MLKRYRVTCFTILFSLFITLNLLSQEVANTKYWIVFKDKGIYKPDMTLTIGSDAYNTAINGLTERAINRRLKVLSSENVVDFLDLPLNENYITGIKNAGINIIAKSKWMNGVSAFLTETQVKEVLKLDFVKGLKLVKQFITQSTALNTPSDNEIISSILLNGEYLYNYGASLKQMDIVNVPYAHNLGFNGNGIMVASFDDGFEWKSHEALRDLKIIDEYDFINEDNNVGKEENQKYKDTPQQGTHGTATLSAFCGFKNGKLVSPSFGATIILAKTEYTATETPMEEDYWLEAAEWAESKGVDVVSSSLGYKVFDEPFTKNSYTYEDYNGRTTIVAIASSRMAHLGVVVCISAGNYNQTDPPSLANGDADSVICVGAIDYNGKIASFSSNGPSFDKRTKPDFVGPGVKVYSALDATLTKTDSTYTGMNGTSLSCPIVAGVCALILSTHPELTPMQVIEALRKTSSLANNPNNVFGYGIVNAYDAILSFGFIWGKYLKAEKPDNNNLTLKIRFASVQKVDENSAICYYRISSSGDYKEVKLVLEKINGDKYNAYEGSALLNGVSELPNCDYYFTVKDAEGTLYTSEVNINK